MRKALEELAVQLACDKITEEGIAELKKCAREFKESLDHDDITQIAEADVRFHDVIYFATDNQRLIQLLNNLREQMYRYRVEYLKRKECHEGLLNEHEELIHMIEAHNKEKATEITNRHIDNQVQAVADLIRKE